MVKKRNGRRNIGNRCLPLSHDALLNDVTGQDGEDDEQEDEGEYDDVDVLVEYLDKRFGSRCRSECENHRLNTTQNDPHIKA